MSLSHKAGNAIFYSYFLRFEISITCCLTPVYYLLSRLLPTTRGAIVRKVVPYTVYGQPHYQVFYFPSGEENKVYEARLGNEAINEKIVEGDPVSDHIIVNLVTKIEKLDKEIP